MTYLTPELPELQDLDLLAEVELLTALISAANEHTGRLSTEVVDDVLGVVPPWRRG
jgi:hypothetical protein